MGRKYLLALILLILILVPTSLAKNNALIIESYGIAQGSISGEYERKMTNKISLAIQGLASKGNRQDLEYTGIGGGLGIKYYLSDQVLNGVYLGASASFINMDVLNPTEGKVTSFGVAGSLGYKWVFETGLAVDVGFSLAMPVLTQITIPESELQETVNFGTVGKGINLGLGFAW
jgi:hypothetical protein